MDSKHFDEIGKRAETIMNLAKMMMNYAAERKQGGINRHLGFIRKKLIEIEVLFK